MKKNLCLMLVPLLVPLAAGAQEPDTTEVGTVTEAPMDVPPADLAAVESARSASCVPAMARMAELDRELAPVNRRGQRIRALAAAVRLEDTTGVAPFDASSALEREVEAWFQADAALGRRQAEGEDVRADRATARDAILARLTEAMTTVAEEGRALIAAAGDAPAVAAACEGAILVRPAVREACGSAGGMVCQAAEEAEPSGPFRFVDRAEDLWDLEQLIPWSDPTSLLLMPDGRIGGARTAALSRRGNLVLAVGIEPIIRARGELTEEQLGRFQANLDTLGFDFDHPDFTMAPGLSVEIDSPGPIGGETHYMLHFGDLSDPANQVVWTVPVPPSGGVAAVFPAAGGALARLSAGEDLSLTAVRFTDAEDREAEAVWTLTLPTVSQPRAVSSLLSYMADGRLARDLAALAPPAGNGGG